VTGRCYEYERSRPHGPLEDILRALLTDGGASPLARLQPWQVAALARLTPELAQHYPSLAAFQGEAETGQEQERLFDAITFFLLDLARQSPLLLALEDVQWASDSVLTWLHYLIRQLADAPIFLIITLALAGPGRIFIDGRAISDSPHGGAFFACTIAPAHRHAHSDRYPYSDRYSVPHGYTYSHRYAVGVHYPRDSALDVAVGNRHRGIVVVNLVAGSSGRVIPQDAVGKSRGGES